MRAAMALVLVLAGTATAGVWRDRTGAVVEVDDDYARSQGYTPVSEDERAAMIRADVEATRRDEGRTRWAWAIAAGVAGIGVLAGAVHLTRRAEARR